MGRLGQIKEVILGTEPHFLHREGMENAPAEWEDGQREETRRGCFEWWYFDAHFDDGSTCVIIFETKPLVRRGGPLDPIVDMAITSRDGIKRTCSLRVSAEEFAASSDGCDIRFGKAWAKGTLRQVEIHMESQDGTLAAHFTLTGIVPPWRPGVGKNYYNDTLTRYFGWLASIPHGTAEGTLTYDGESHTLKGTGYHDHNWGNVGLDEVMDHWYWGRTHIGDFSTIFVMETAAPAYGKQKIPVFLLAKGDRILTGDGNPLHLELGEFICHPAGRSYPSRLDYSWQKGEDRVHIALRQPELIEATSLLYFLPRWQQRLLRLVVNPYYFRFRASMELDVDIEDTHVREKGSALYEMMILR